MTIVLVPKGCIDICHHEVTSSITSPAGKKLQQPSRYIAPSQDCAGAIVALSSPTDWKCQRPCYLSWAEFFKEKFLQLWTYYQIPIFFKSKTDSSWPCGHGLHGNTWPGMWELSQLCVRTEWWRSRSEVLEATSRQDACLNMKPVVRKMERKEAGISGGADDSPELQQSSEKLHHESLFKRRTRRSCVLRRRRAFCLARGFQLQSVLTNALRTHGICLNTDSVGVTRGFKVQLEKAARILDIHLNIPLFYHIKESPGTRGQFFNSS